MKVPGAMRVGRTIALLIWAAIVIVIADLIVYQLLIRAQGQAPPDSVAVVPFVSAYMLVMATALIASFGGQPVLVRLRPAMLASASAGLLLLGLIGAFSIGVPLLLAGILATIAGILVMVERSSRNAVLSQVGAALIAVVVLIGGLEVAQRIVVCPPDGTMGGGSSGFLTGAYHYQCVNGELRWYSGDCNGVQGGVDANGNPTSSNGC